MMSQTTPSSEDVLTAFVAIYPEYVRAGLTDLGYAATPAMEEAIEEGTGWLAAELSDLLRQTPVEQRRSPLEVFQEALRFPNEVLSAEAWPEPDRDPTAVAALPGDRYGLAPASSQALGEQAWRAHLAWGIDKAEAVAGVVPADDSGDEADDARLPRVALVGTDLMDRSRIEAGVEPIGYRLVVWRNPGAVEAGLAAARRPVVAFVDLTHPVADDIIRTLTGAGMRVIAYGPHVDDNALARARSLGAAEALPRSRFFRRIPDLLPAIA